MEAKGVIFNLGKNINLIESYTVTITGDQDRYISTIKSLISLIRNVREDMNNKDEIIDVCDLIADMLPLPEQLIIENINPNN
ncbi:MAG: hypothetical protein ACOYN4_08935 [Bacteroidales bacterium]